MATDCKHICVVGAGPSGLTAIKGCLEAGLNVTCFEATDDIGGLWRYTEEVVNNKGSVAKTTVINTSKEMMAFSDFPVPTDRPNFMPHELVLDYFQSYTNHFGLGRHIRFNTKIVKVNYADDYATTGKWNVTYSDQTSGTIGTAIFDGVLVCTGHLAEPHTPDFPGLKNFQGKVMHTHEYRSVTPFIGKNILIVGIGNSAGDAATEVSKFAKSVHISTRHGSWCVPRSLSGWPLDSNFTRFMLLILGNAPYWLIDLYAEYFIIPVDHDLIGLRPPYGPTAQHMMVNDDFPNRLLSGLIKLKPNVKSFGPNSATFVDGTEVTDIDVVIFGTGYVFGFPFLPPSLVSVEANEVDLYKMMFPPDLLHPTLAIIGCVQPAGSIMPISELQVRWATRVFMKEKSLPSQEEQRAEIRQRRKGLSQRFVASQRHTLEVQSIPYMDSLAREIGCMPSVLPMLLSGDFSFAYQYYFGQAVPYHYRLVGPNAWPGAREAILSVEDRIRAPLKTPIYELYSNNK